MNEKKIKLHNDSPRWVIETLIDFKNDVDGTKWKFNMDKEPMFIRDGFHKFEAIEDCTRELIDQGISVGVVYDSTHCTLHLPPHFLLENASSRDKFIYKILEMTKFNFHSKCPMTFLLKRNKWFKWMCDVCDFGVDPSSPYYSLYDNVMMVKLVTKDTEIMVDRFFKDFLDK